MSANPEDIREDINQDLAHYYGIDINPSGSKYTYQDRYNAVLYWIVYGNTRKVSEVMNIPRNTILDWKKTEWWHTLNTNLREEKREQFNAGFTRLVERGINHIEQCFDNQEVSAMEAAKIMGIAFDKRQILNNQPTSISGNVSNDALKALKAQFEALAGKTIDAEVISKD